MALPGTQTVTLSGRFLHPSGAARSGVVLISPSTDVKSPSGDFLAPSDPIAVGLDDLGAFAVPLTATDDPTITPTGYSYTLRAHLDGNDTRAYHFRLPSTLGASVDLSDLVKLPAPSVGIVQPMPVYVGGTSAPQVGLGFKAATVPLGWNLRFLSEGDGTIWSPRPWLGEVGQIAAWADPLDPIGDTNAFVSSLSSPLAGNVGLRFYVSAQRLPASPAFEFDVYAPSGGPYSFGFMSTNVGAVTVRDDGVIEATGNGSISVVQGWTLDLSLETGWNTVRVVVGSTADTSAEFQFAALTLSER